jgi:membrane-bound metal-dependent hydrolase YbcI (DUF457 family)
MPSPLAHTLAGVAVAWAADLVPGDRAGRTAPPRASLYRQAGGGLTLVCAALAAGPDLDLLFDPYHRTATHSVTAVAAVAIIAALVAPFVGRSAPRLAAMCGGAVATHLVLDWMAADRLFAPYGVQLLWPFSDRWFISGWDVFSGTERHNLFSAASLATNAAAASRELIVMVPILVVLWLVRVKALAGFPSELARRDHPPQ